MKLKIDTPSTEEHLSTLYRFGGIGKTADGSYMVCCADENGESGWTTMSPEEAAESIGSDLEGLDLVREKILQLRGKLPEINALILENETEANGFYFDDETAFGEPTAWIYLKDGTSIEVTHEEEGIEEESQYFSARLHCSDEDFDSNKYHGTIGIIDQRSGGLSDIAPFICSEAEKRGLIPMQKTVTVEIGAVYKKKIKVPIPDGDLTGLYGEESAAVGEAFKEALNMLPDEIKNGWKLSVRDAFIEEQGMERNPITRKGEKK